MPRTPSHPGPLPNLTWRLHFFPADLTHSSASYLLAEPILPTAHAARPTPAPSCWRGACTAPLHPSIFDCALPPRGALHFTPLVYHRLSPHSSHNSTAAPWGCALSHLLLCGCVPCLSCYWGLACLAPSCLAVRPPTSLSQYLPCFPGPLGCWMAPWPVPLYSTSFHTIRCFAGLGVSPC